MTTPLICYKRNRLGDLRPSWFFRVLVLLGAAVLLPLPMAGCQATKNVKAAYHLTSNPVLVLVDDESNRIRPALAKRYLSEAIAQELVSTQSALQVIPEETLNTLRQVHPDFEKRGCREIGELAGAEQVVWVQVQEFLAEEDFSDALEAAYVHATVKVINVLEKESRSRVRVWPPMGAGAEVSATLSGADVARFRTQETIAKELAGKLAVRVARFFHDHVLEGKEAFDADKLSAAAP